IKISILEDSVKDLEEIYSSVPRDSSRIFYFIHETDANPEEKFEYICMRLTKMGFERQNIFPGYNKEHDSETDVYFIDGLEGAAISIIEKNNIQKDRVYISTSNEELRMECGKQGYKTIIK